MNEAAVRARRLGREAAEAGEKRSWCEQYGQDCLDGYDAYWAEMEDGLSAARTNYRPSGWRANYRAQPLDEVSATHFIEGGEGLVTIDVREPSRGAQLGPQLAVLGLTEAQAVRLRTELNAMILTPASLLQVYPSPAEAPADEPLHLVTQRDQPMGSERRCCERCGRMCWRGMKGSASRWTDQPETWGAAPDRCT